MRLKNNWFLFLSLFLAIPALALVEIPKGVISAEGKIIWEKDKAYFLINPNTMSQTKLALNGDLKELRGQDHSNAKVKLELDKKIFSAEGEAKFLKVEKFLHPKDSPKEYIETKEFQ